MAAGCGSGKKDNATLETKKAKLAELQKKQDALTLEIIQLQQEIDVLDSVSATAKTGKLVTAQKAELKHFRHFIEMQGTATSKENVAILPEASGVIKQILVTEGQSVSKGQVLMILDDEALAKQIDEVQTGYELANTIYEKQKMLWEQKIGSEVQFLEAKNKKETAEKALERLNIQLSKFRVTSPINGTVDEINVNAGELASPQRQVIRIVNLDEVQVHADASENYISAVHKGDSVLVNFPAINVSKRTIIHAVGQVINPVNRTFGVDVKLSNADKSLKANLMAIMKVSDYENKKALTVPTKWIQQDGNQDFLYVAVTEGGKTIAKKRTVKKGNTYNGETEILEGLIAGDNVITEGSRDITDGEVVRFN